MKRKESLTPAFVLAGSIITVAWLLYKRRPRDRIVSQESLEDPEVSKAFDRIARMPQMRLLRGYAIKRALKLIDHGQAVDLGCGTGLLVLEMAQQAADLHVTGIDLSDEMLLQAGGYAHRTGLEEQVSFRKGDAANIPFPDHGLDLVVSTLSLHHWRDPIPVLDEVDRVLRPGGAYIIFDLRRDMTPFAYLLLWVVTNFVVPTVLYRINEPLGSRNAAYTTKEAASIAGRSSLSGWRITQGPLWLTIEGVKTQGEAS
jgi:ubiquinone/menaquinone biosynthesis C-methylase UbiE